ncbi:hypothetical protein [Microbacterium rhizomatis]|uniref:Uncharacterized protein n=1 Tax=Microbacterium rhizomatis TaxID=1631477 RepID=A0A5J5J0E7_9MICO|nr:hypothetical protein [Microbacterium rhizomatis]KAA9105942.1 hypothetical protein F6B43_16400 [Microbacterium rhizomatis]
MTRQTVSWIQHAEVVVTVDIELNELAAWAAKSAYVRALVGTDATSADVMQVQRLLESNGHVRDALIRLWVTSRATENG